MKYDSQILAFIAVGQINYKSAGEPFATLLKTCHSRVGFFKSIFSLKQNNRNSILSRAAAFILIEHASIFYFSEDKDFEPASFHKWYWTLCADRYIEEWGRSEQAAQRFLQITYQIRDEFENMPVVLYPENDGYKRIAYFVAKRVITLTGSNYIQSEVQKLALKLEKISERFCSYLKNHHPDVGVVDTVNAFCNSKKEAAEFFAKTLPFAEPQQVNDSTNKLKNQGVKTYERGSLPVEEEVAGDSRSSKMQVVEDKKDNEPLSQSFIQFHLVMLAKHKQNIIFPTCLKYSLNLKKYSVELEDKKYPEDILFINYLLADFLTFGRYQKPVDDFSVRIFSDQSKLNPKNSLSLADINVLIKSYFDGVIYLLLCCLPVFMQSKKGMDLAEEIKRELSIELLINKINKSSGSNDNNLFKDFIESQVYKFLSKFIPQASEKDIDVFEDSLREIFLTFANIVTVSYIAAFENVRFKKEADTLEFLDEVKSDIPRFEKAIRNRLGMNKANLSD